MDGERSSDMSVLKEGCVFQHVQGEAGFWFGGLCIAEPRIGEKCVQPVLKRFRIRGFRLAIIGIEKVMILGMV